MNRSLIQWLIFLIARWFLTVEKLKHSKILKIQTCKSIRGVRTNRILLNDFIICSPTLSPKRKIPQKTKYIIPSHNIGGWVDFFISNIVEYFARFWLYEETRGRGLNPGTGGDSRPAVKTLIARREIINYVFSPLSLSSARRLSAQYRVQLGKRHSSEAR